MVYRVAIMAHIPCCIHLGCDGGKAFETADIEWVFGIRPVSKLRQKPVECRIIGKSFSNLIGVRKFYSRFIYKREIK